MGDVVELDSVRRVLATQDTRTQMRIAGARARANLIRNGLWERELEARAEIAERVNNYDRVRNGPMILKAGSTLIPFRDVRFVDISEIDNRIAKITTYSGDVYEARGFDAVEAVWAMKPSAIEGKRLRFKKNGWAFHNLVGHPVMQILAWMGFRKAAIRFHDYTTPQAR